MRLGDLDRLAKDIELAVEDAPLHVQATVQQYIDCSPTIDPIRAAGGCRCGECAAYEGHICKNTGFYKSETGWCNDGVPREEQRDG